MAKPAFSKLQRKYPAMATDIEHRHASTVLAGNGRSCVGQQGRPISMEEIVGIVAHAERRHLTEFDLVDPGSERIDLPSIRRVAAGVYETLFESERRHCCRNSNLWKQVLGIVQPILLAPMPPVREAIGGLRWTDPREALVDGGVVGESVGVLIEKESAQIRCGRSGITAKRPLRDSHKASPGMAGPGPS